MPPQLQLQIPHYLYPSTFTPSELWSAAGGGGPRVDVLMNRAEKLTLPCLTILPAPHPESVPGRKEKLHQINDTVCRTVCVCVCVCVCACVCNYSEGGILETMASVLHRQLSVERAEAVITFYYL